MRLINADARVTVQSFDPMNEEYSHDEMTVERALDFATDEGCPPTIDAIPVEWLETHAREYYEDWGEEPITVENALKMWQREQEENNER